MSPNEPLPIFLPSRYFPPTRSSITESNRQQNKNKKQVDDAFLGRETQTVFSGWGDRRRKLLATSRIELDSFRSADALSARYLTMRGDFGFSQRKLRRTSSKCTTLVLRLQLWHFQLHSWLSLSYTWQKLWNFRHFYRTATQTHEVCTKKSDQFLFLFPDPCRASGNGNGTSWRRGNVSGWPNAKSSSPSLFLDTSQYILQHTLCQTVSHIPVEQDSQHCNFLRDYRKWTTAPHTCGCTMTLTRSLSPTASYRKECGWGVFIAIDHQLY